MIKNPCNFHMKISKYLLQMIINQHINNVSLSNVQRKQNTVTRDKKETEMIARGRHDPCVVPRGLY